MNKVGCHEIAAQLQGDVYLLLVAEGCPYCAEVLNKISSGKVPLRRETVVVNTDSCIEEVDRLVKWSATPMIAHFKQGQELRRGVGVDGIMSFDSAAVPVAEGVKPTAATETGKPTSARVEENDPLLLEAIGTRK